MSPDSLPIAATVRLVQDVLMPMLVLLFEQAEADTWRARVPKLLIDLDRLFLILLVPEPDVFTLGYADFAITHEVKSFILDCGKIE